ncbi:hypothetical protein Q1695_008535 [Nippostrongylus brasiliensis]|nr:hypothetical protein Q1695_008535 [Nippostrongylus brasiliensis]
MRPSFVHDVAKVLLAAVFLSNTLIHAFKAVAPGSDMPDDGKPWYVTTDADWTTNPVRRPGLKIKAFKKPRMSVVEAEELCKRNNAKLADMGMILRVRVHELFPFKAWIKVPNHPCTAFEAHDGGVHNFSDCDARPDYAICERS